MKLRVVTMSNISEHIKKPVFKLILIRMSIVARKKMNVYSTFIPESNKRLIKLNMHLLYNPEIPLQDINSKAKKIS